MESVEKVNPIKRKLKTKEIGEPADFAGKSMELKNRLQHSIYEIYNSSNDLILLLDENGTIRFSNQSVKYKLGYSDKEMANLLLQKLIHPDYLQQFLEKISAVIQTNTSTRITSILLTKFGKNIYVNGEINTQMDIDVLPCYRCVLYDVSERIRAESFQSLFYSIASLTTHEYDLDSLHKRIFNELSKHLKVKNYSLIQYSDLKVSFQFRVSESSKSNKVVDSMLGSYTLNRGKPVIIYEDGIRKIAEQSNIKIPKSIPGIWLGVPMVGGDYKYVITISAVNDQTVYNHKDLELLDFIGGQLSIAIERKKSQEKIVEQAARINAIFDSSTHQIWSLDKKLRFTAFNENYANSFNEYFGVFPEIGMSIAEMYDQKLDLESRNNWYEKYKESFAGKTVNFQSRLYTRNGTLVWRDVYLNPIFFPDGRIEEISIIANDITEKKNADKALVSSEEKFRNIVESFQDIYFRCSMDGKINMVSPSILEILGYASPEVLGRPIEGFFINQNNLRELIKRLLSETRVRDFEATVQSRSGKTVNFLCNIRLIKANNSNYEIEGVAKDITQIKATNQALKLSKEVAEHSLKIKERFLANMSHEIRTPMNGIIGMIDLISTTPLNNEQSGYIRTIRKSSDSLMTILNDILDLSKIEAGKMQLKLEPIKLMETIEKVYDLYSQQAHLNKTHLYYYVDDNLPDIVLVDETRLIQVISNLTSNAIKFSQKKGNIDLSISLIEKNKNDYKFRVAVKDSGIGIAPEDQPKLFTSFNQLDSSNKKLFAGTGLGLAISKELVKSMNGEIGVVSTPGFGSTFWFTFTAQKPTKNQKIPGRQQLRQHHFIHKSPRILLVDDNEINRKVAYGILTKSGCSVKPAASGKEALHLISTDEFDLIFMDIQMPEMDGVEAAARIKSLNLKKTPPIVAMTAYSMEEDRIRFLEQGLDDYLPKPIKSQILIEKVREWTDYEVQEIEITALKESTEDLIINQNTLNQLHKYGGKELIRSVLEEFKAETVQLLKQSALCIEEEDYECIKSQMHTLKGNAGTLGIEKLSTQAAVVEKKIKENKFGKLKYELEKLKKIFNEFNENYKNIIKNE